MNLGSYAVAGLQIYLSTKIGNRPRSINKETSPGSGIYTAALSTLNIPITIEEFHSDSLEITDHPVDAGAMVTDHAFKLPPEVVIKLGWTLSASGNNSNTFGNAAIGTAGSLATQSPMTLQVANLAAAAWGVVEASKATTQQALVTLGVGDSLSDIYSTLLELQSSRTLIDVVTGKREYSSMLIKSLTTVTDKSTENSLMITMTLRKVLLVSVLTTSGVAAGTQYSQVRNNGQQGTK